MINPSKSYLFRFSNAGGPALFSLRAKEDLLTLSLVAYVVHKVVSHAASGTSLLVFGRKMEPGE